MSGGRRGRIATVGVVPLAMVVTLALAATGCSVGGDAPAPNPTSQRPAKPTALSFGIYGSEDEISSFQAVVDNYNSLNDRSDVEIRSWADHGGLRNALESGDVPDVFMVSRGDLAWLQEQGLTQPVDGLLDERGVDFGDGYSRDALEAFSADNRLQCMPYGISPMVIYYNTALVDFAKMRARGLDAPDLENGSDPRWSFDQFVAAANFATRPGRNTRGVYVDPTLRGLAPFIYSGGGTLFADGDQPTSLAFSDGGTRDALGRTLALLRDPQLNLTESQLAKATPLQWFERGRVGMIEGFRSLVPELRQVQGLEFDVMPMPVLDRGATVGDITGLCLSSDAASTPQAADFLVHALSTESVARVVRAGYLAPANLEVALSDAFLQSGRLPDHAGVFNSGVRSMVIPPELDSYDELEAAVRGSLEELVSVTVLDLTTLEGLTGQIDEESRTVLDPANATASPTE